MAKIVEYYVVRQDNLDDLISEVNNMLSAGWRCVGGACVFTGDKDSRYKTTMKRERSA